ncbi:alpha/beta fold hydrolase [Massilia sp. TN1-12]|uniref:alpha/beta fold hydrolase n=1 Tax=Massilia paldalensis TaxID=3377675 RepID=UPI00384E6C4A
MSDPVVVVHGLFNAFAPIAPQRLLPGVDVRMPDLAGYGRLRSVDAGIDLPSQARALADFLRDEVGRPAWLLGHSVGGALAWLVADLVPERVRGIVNVEGNFTLKDAFWCGRIAALPEAEWAAEYGAMEDAPGAWLERMGIEASDEHVAFAREMLANQPYTTLQRLAQSVLDVTGSPDYLERVRRVLLRGTPLWLVGGEQSAAGWDIPEWVLAAARAIHVQPKTGHMMMLEDPSGFCAIVARILAEENPA